MSVKEREVNETISCGCKTVLQILVDARELLWTSNEIWRNDRTSTTPNASPPDYIAHLLSPFCSKGV